MCSCIKIANHNELTSFIIYYLYYIKTIEYHIDVVLCAVTKTKIIIKSRETFLDHNLLIELPLLVYTIFLG